MEIKITKKQCIYKEYNDMVANEYWLVAGKIYNDDKTFSKRFRLVIWYDLQDVQEYFDKDYATEKDKKLYLDELIYSYTDTINDYKDTKEFYDLCNNTINNYNKLIQSF